MEEEGVTELSLSGQGLKELPADVAEKHGHTLIKLDLTENQISNGRNFKGLEKLETLILDKNSLVEFDKYPKLPSMRTLWLNNNNISDINTVIDQIHYNFPNLTYLSMLMNPSAPNVFLDDTAAEAYQRFRYLIIHKIPRLQFLDSTPITEEEKKEAQRVGQYMKVAKPKGAPVTESAEEVETKVKKAKASKQHFSAAPPKAATFLAKGKPRYDGSNSEGNRFIVNDDL
jgi:hypothetical protein